MRRLLLVRHAQSSWNAEGRWQGAADPPLSPEGEHQAERGGEALASALAAGDLPGPLEEVWSSDLLRARQTAAALARACGWEAAVRLEPGLREHDVGAWSGLTRAEIDRRWPGLVDAWSAGALPATPGGEARAVFDARVREAATRVAGIPGDGLAVVVTHGGVLRSLARWLGVEDRAPGNLQGFVVDGGGPGGAMRHVADVALAPAVPATPQ